MALTSCWRTLAGDIPNTRCCGWRRSTTNDAITPRRWHGSIDWPKSFPRAALADRAALGRGYALYKLGRSTEADGVLNGLLKHPQLGVDAHYWLGMSQFSREAWQEAAATFVAGAAIDSQHRWNETLSYQAACALLNDGQFGQAAAQFDRVLERWPKTAWAEACWLGKLQAAAAQNDHAAVVRMAGELAAKFPAGAT